MTGRPSKPSRFCLAITLSVLAAVSDCSQAQSSAKTSLCRADESVFFNCTIGSHHKMVSLCGAGDLKQRSGHLRYRFGRHGRIELSYPQAGNGVNDFKYSHYSRYEVERTVVSFTNGDYQYRLFDDDESDIAPAIHRQGIEVSKLRGDDTPTTLYCRAPVYSKLQTLGRTLPCDRDDPLNMGSCPAR
ncbi:hypothetical protein [Mangrovitalea sediminis]|uniref:hypothetical protein n=1 Tax=Mangrovitalea sediminis TaxID=1982043 RepID=UPI000BE50E14|nr:hypothetical protein [Mangrovitalea sediminis]